MNHAATNWTPGIIAVVIGLAVSLVVLLLMMRKKSPTPAADARLAELQGRAQLLIDQLRALEAERHQLGDRYDAEKTRLEAAAAQAMKACATYVASREGAAAAVRAGNPAATATASAGAAAAAAVTAPAAQAPRGFFGRHPELKGALWGMGIVGFCVMVGLVMTREQTVRTDGVGMTGATPPNDPVPAKAGQAAAGADPLEGDPQFQMYLERAQKNPADTEASAMVSHELIRMQRFDEAEKLTQGALAADPFHVESRIHRAVLRATRGEFREAIADLGHLTRTYPDSHEALLFRGALAMQVGDSKLALESFERFLAESPPEEHPPQLASAIQMLRQRAAAP